VGALTDWLTSTKPTAAIGNFLTEKFAPAALQVLEPLEKPMMAADKAFETVVRDPIGAAALESAYIARGDVLPVKEAYKATDRISYGEAVQYNLFQTALRPVRGAVGEVVESVGGKKAVEKTYNFLPLLNPDYDILDEEQRQAAQESPFYQFITGLTDIGLEVFVGAKGVGAATRFAKIKTGLARDLKKPAEVVEQLENEASAGLVNLQNQLDNGISIDNATAINGITEDILGTLKAKDDFEMLAIPSVYNASNPLFLKNLLLAAKTPAQKTDIILAEYGSVNALKRLQKERPAFADSIELSKTPVQLEFPLTIDEASQTFKTIDNVSESQKLNSVLQDIIQNDPRLQNDYQNWYTTKLSGEANVLSWSPAKFSFVQKLQQGTSGWKVDRIIGAKGGIGESIIGGGDVRPFRILSLNALRLKPRSYLDYTYPNPLDGLEELSAVILSNKLLRKEVNINGVTTSNFRKQQLKIWADAVNEPQKDIAIETIEINIAQRMAATVAQEMKRTEVLDTAPAMAFVQAKRDNIVNKARNTENGLVAEELGSKEVLAVNETLKFKLQNSKPMLDLNLLEQEIRAQYGASLSTMVKGKLQSIPAVFDSFERAFSAAVLIRPGYIPKNSIFEPFMRLLGITHAVTLPRMYRENIQTFDILDDVTGEVVSKKLDIIGQDTPGGNALAVEWGAAANLANVTNPKAAIDAKVKKLSEVRVDPNNSAQKGLLKDYWTTYTGRVYQLKNDTVGQRIMRGADNNQIVSYLRRDLDANGRFSIAYRLIEEDLATKGLTTSGKQLGLQDLSNANLLKLVERYRKEIKSLIPNEELQKTIAAMDKVFTVKLAESMTKGMKLPALNVATNRLPGLDEPFSRASKSAQGLINKGFNAIAKPEVLLFRNQFGRYYGTQMVKTMVEGYKKQNIPITMELWTNTIRPAAQEYALKQVRETFYSIRRMNNVQYYSRFLLGFPTAMFNSVKFWTRQGYNNPYNFALLEQLRTSPWAVGMVVDEEGNPISPEEARKGERAAYLTVPFFNKPNQKTRAFTIKMNTEQVNFLVNGPAPNWLGQASINTLIQTTPSLETTLKDFMGEKAYNRLIFGGVPRGIVPEARELQGKNPFDIGLGFAGNLIEQTFIPGSATSGIQAIRTQIAGKDLKFSSDAVASSLWSIHTAKRIDWELNNPDSPEPQLDESIKDTVKFMQWRFLTRLLSPIGLTFEPNTIFYRDEFDRLELNYANNPELLADKPGIAPYQAAAQDFISLYGNEAMRALVSGTKFTTSIAPEQEAVRRFDEYKWLEKWVGDAPANRLPVVGMVLNPVVPGEYSPAASAYLRTQTIAGEPLGTGVKTFAEREREAIEKEGWREYDSIVKKRDAALAGRRFKSITAKSNNDIRLEFIADINLLNSKNSAWEEAFGNSENTFPESLNLIKTALSNEQFIKDISKSDAEKKLWTSVAVWVQERDRLFSEWQNAKIGSSQRKRLRREYENLILALTESNTYFSDFANRYLNGDPMADIREIIQTEEVA
jgi:hypothetical protein